MNTKFISITALADYVRAAAFKIFGQKVGIDPATGTKPDGADRIVHITPPYGSTPKMHKQFIEMMKSVGSVERTEYDPKFKKGSIKVVFKKSVTSATDNPDPKVDSVNDDGTPLEIAKWLMEKKGSVKSNTIQKKSPMPVTALADYVRAAAFKIFGKQVGIDPSTGTKLLNGERVIHIVPQLGVPLAKHKEFAEMLKGINSVDHSSPDNDFKKGAIKVVMKKNVTSKKVAK